MFDKLFHVRKAGILILAIAVAFSFSGCGKSHDESGPDSLLNASTGSNDASYSSAESESEGVSFEAKLSYVNSEYVMTGDDSEEKLLRNVKKTLSAADSDEILQIKAVIQALRTVPEDLEDAETFVGDVTVNSMRFRSNSLVMDLSSDGLEDMDMYNEQFFIYQITDSILNTFPDLEGVRFTIDGTNKDALNYVDISSAFTASDVSSFVKGETEKAKDFEENEDTSTDKKKSSENATKEDTAKNSDDDEDTDSANNSKKSSSSSSEKQSTGSSSSGSQSQSSSGNNKSSSSSSSTANSSSSGNKSGNSSSSSGNSGNKNSSSSGNSNGNSSGVTTDSSSSSGGTGSSGNQDGVVDDEA